MRYSKRFIWLRVSQLFAAVFAGVVLACFWVPWMTSHTTGEALQQFPGEVDPLWRAVSVDHSRVSEWRLGTPRQNPVAFGLCTAAMLSAMIYCVIIAVWMERHKKDETRDT